MEKKKFSLENVQNSNIDFVGGDRQKKKLPNKGEMPEKQGLEVLIRDISDTTAKITLGDDLSARGNFQVGLDALEVLLLANTQPQNKDKLQQTINEIKKESGKKKIDASKLKKLLGLLLKLANIEKMDPQIIEKVQNFISSFLVKIVG